jgi:hypothetical protein
MWAFILLLATFILLTTTMMGVLQSFHETLQVSSCELFKLPVVNCSMSGGAQDSRLQGRCSSPRHYAGGHCACNHMDWCFVGQQEKGWSLVQNFMVCQNDFPMCSITVFSSCSTMLSDCGCRGMICIFQINNHCDTSMVVVIESSSLGH